MHEIMEYLREFNFATTCIRLVFAFLCGGFIGMERGMRGRAAGLRTHILVCLGSAMAAMTGLFASTTLEFSNDPTRIAAQVISGIGFLGVGTILITGRSHVTGLTTAAGLWTTAAIGLAVGMGFYEAALVCTALAVLTITLLNLFESAVINKKAGSTEIYIEISDSTSVNAIVEKITTAYNVVRTEIKPARSGIQGHLGIEALLHVGKNKDETATKRIIAEIAEIEDVCFAIDSI